jgi:hypothetical protein
MDLLRPVEKGIIGAKLVQRVLGDGVGGAEVEKTLTCGACLQG